ncbi:MAG TPA: adenylate cyclase regulatory domain-containing protein [Mycobacteriales bacterium]|nr:adenylate cyclase regulatory domain-containing protein [Mycobacteriales bacterium]
MDLGEYAAAGLYDPASPEAESRAELLTYLVEIGCTLEEMVAANARGRLFALAGDRVIVPGRDQFSLSDISTTTGAPLANVRAIWRALGYVDAADDELVASLEEVEAVRVCTDMVALLGMPGVLGVCRVVASSLSRVADAVSGAVRTQVPQLELGASGSEAVTARTFAGIATFVPRMGHSLDTLFRHHLEVARMHWERSDSGDLVDSGGVRVGVGFADLSGFTGLTEGLSMASLSQLLTGFEEVAEDVVRDRDGRVVKFIGDAVMYVTHDALAAVQVAQGLIEAAQIRGLQARAGVAVGVVLALQGDYFGPVVNLAARLVALAGAGEVFVTDEVVEQIGGVVQTDSLGARAIRGFSQEIAIARLR